MHVPFPQAAVLRLVKCDGSTFFMSGIKSPHYLTDITEIGVLRNYTCVFDNPRLKNGKYESGDWAAPSGQPNQSESIQIEAQAAIMSSV